MLKLRRKYAILRCSKWAEYRLRRKAMYEHDFCEYAVKKKSAAHTLQSWCSRCLPRRSSWSAFCADPAGGRTVFRRDHLHAVCHADVVSLALCRDRVRIHADRRDLRCGVGLQQAVSARAGLGRSEESARLVAPYKNGRIEGGFAPKKIRDLRSSPDVPHAYIIVYETGDGTEAVLFDASARMVENIRMQVPSVTVLSDGLPE